MHDWMANVRKITESVRVYTLKPFSVIFSNNFLAFVSDPPLFNGFLRTIVWTFAFHKIPCLEVAFGIL